METSNNDRASSVSRRRRKRQRKSEPLPSFCDATTSVVASTFAASRLEEIQTLYHHTVSADNGHNDGRQEQHRYPQTQPYALDTALDSNAYRSQACRTASRHLRRRATSHNPRGRRRHRYPLADFTRARVDDCTGGGAVDGAATDDSEVVAPSDKRNVTQQQRPEIKPDSVDEETPTKKSRRSRRNNRSWLKSQHEQWQEPVQFLHSMQAVPEKPASSLEANTNDKDSQPKTTDDSTKTDNHPCHWIPTHLWHAKRFHMEQLWGWKVPMLHINRGAKAALRLCREGKCLVQDTSWRMQPICCTLKTRRSMSSNNNNNNPAATVFNRLIPEFPYFPPAPLTEGSKDSKLVAGQGMFHELDQSPLAAIGPVQWLIVQDPNLWLGWKDGDQSLGSENQADSNCEQGNHGNQTLCHCYSIYLFVHPAIFASCWSSLKRVLSLLPLLTLGTIMSDVRLVKGGLSCLSLRGHSARECLTKSVEALCGREQCGVASTTLINIMKEGTNLIDVEMGGTTERICVVTVNQRDGTRIWNHGVNGIDVLCRHSCAAQLFLALVLQGGACPIGLTEESHLCLESQPPIPLFPRDYPDTAAGRAYWGVKIRKSEDGTKKAVSSDAINAKIACPVVIDDSAVLRQYLEGGLGRVSASHGRQQKLAIDWTAFVTMNLQSCSSDPVVVMMRGLFVKPIADLVCCMTGVSRKEESQKGVDIDLLNDKKEHETKHKRRRPSKNPTDYVRVPPPGLKEIGLFQINCRNLLQSLSLPATLLAHVRIEDGEGALVAGAALMSLSPPQGTAVVKSDDRLLLGYITTGAFSHNRGRCHGLAVLGAARFLEELSRAHQTKALVFVREFFGSLVNIICYYGK
ncbi:hypothetical protein ACA910_021517 [Epithemia clementina (nom. ined.)]